MVHLIVFSGSEHDLLWLPRALPPGVHMLLSTLPGRVNLGNYFTCMQAWHTPANVHSVVQYILYVQKLVRECMHTHRYINVYPDVCACKHVHDFINIYN